jgi:PAS domain-containing protein
MADTPLTIPAIANDRRGDTHRQLLVGAARFKALFNAVPIPIYLWQSDGTQLRLSDYNPAAHEFTTGRISTLIGRTLLDIHQSSPALIDHMMQCFETGRNIRETMDHTLVSTGEAVRLDVTYVFSPPAGVAVITIPLR